MKKVTLFALVLIASSLAAPAFGAATITIVNIDGAGEGFNDPGPPLLPAPGNTGTTLGEQRLQVFEAAAALWGDTIDSEVEIFVRASFDPLFCDATSAVLGSAGTLVVQQNFDNAIFADTWYHSALANKLAGEDLDPPPPVGLQGDDIQARFNVDIDNNPGCLGPTNWYYGLDNLPGPGTTDLFQVVKHEIAHGLGFANFANETTGALFLDTPDIYTQFTRDNTTGLLWSEMNDAERVASAINDQNVVWVGPAATNEAPNVLANPPVMEINSPGGIAGTYPAQAASYGPQLSLAGVTGNVVLAIDGAGADPNDGCEPLTNGGAVAGNIVLINRGNCAFVTKSVNGDNAGATAVIVANNVAPGLPPMGGTDPGTLNIPSVGITQADGDLIKGEADGSVNVTLQIDATQFSGTDANGFMKLFAPNPVQQGSSISHWDTTASPNLLMEPFINPDIGTDVDLTDELFADIGWFAGGVNVLEIPTIDTVGMIGLALLLLAAAFWVMSRRNRKGEVS